MSKPLTAEHREILADAIQYVESGQLPEGREGWKVLGQFVETCQVIGGAAYTATPALRAWTKRWETAAYQTGKRPHTFCVQELLKAIRETLDPTPTTGDTVSKKVQWEGTPIKRRDGWGVKIVYKKDALTGDPEPGDLVQVTTRRGYQWIKEIAEVVAETQEKGMRTRGVIATTVE